METLTLRPGDELPLAAAGLEWKRSDGSRCGHTKYANRGAVCKETSIADSTVKREIRLRVSPVYDVQLVESSRTHVLIDAPAGYEAHVQWTVISLGMMQRVQRLLTWETLVNDAKALIPLVIAVVQAGGSLATDVVGGPSDWDNSAVRDALLRLIDTGNPAHFAAKLSNGTIVHVDQAGSRARIADWEPSPAYALTLAGEDAAALLRVYLQLQFDLAVAPEVQTFTGPQLYVPLEPFTGIAPHNGASVVITAHRGRELIGLYEVHVLPSDVQIAPRGSAFVLRGATAPTAFSAFSGSIRRRYKAHWNDYNLGWRGSTVYAQPGDSIEAATAVFSAGASDSGVSGLPFMRGFAPTYTDESFVLPMSSNDGTLLMQFSDFGADPFLRHLIGPSAAWSASPAFAGAVEDSFAWPVDASATLPVPGWAPRRLQASVFAPIFRVQLSAFATPAVERAVDAVQAIHDFRVARNAVQSLPEHQYQLLGRSTTDLLQSQVDANDEFKQGRLLDDAIYRMFSIANGKRMDTNDEFEQGRLPDDAVYHLFPVVSGEKRDNFLDFAQKMRKAHDLTFVDVMGANAVLKGALASVTTRIGRVAILPLLRQSVANLAAFPSSDDTNASMRVASAAVASLQYKATKLQVLSTRYQGIPVIDDSLTFADVRISPVLQRNSTVLAGDRAFLERFKYADIEAVVAGAESSETEHIDAQKTLAAAAKAMPVPVIVLGPSTSPVVRPGSRPVVVVPSPGATQPAAPSQEAGWAFLGVTHPNVATAVAAFPFATDKKLTYLLRDTGLLPVLGTGTIESGTGTIESGPLSQNLERFIQEEWTPLESLVAGQSTLAALDALLRPRPAPAVTTVPATTIVSPAPAVTPPQTNVEAERIAQIQTRLGTLFGSTLGSAISGDVSSLDAKTVESLQRFESMLVGTQLLDVFDWPQIKAANAAQTAQALRSKVAPIVGELGFPSTFVDIVAGAQPKEREAFENLAKFELMPELRLSRALDAFGAKRLSSQKT